MFAIIISRTPTKSILFHRISIPLCINRGISPVYYLPNNFQACIDPSRQCLGQYHSKTPNCHLNLQNKPTFFAKACRDHKINATLFQFTWKIFSCIFLSFGIEIHKLVLCNMFWVIFPMHSSM